MSIVDIPENDVSNVVGKKYKIKVRTYSIKSSSTFFCSKLAMYNIVHCSQNKYPVLKSYIPGINTYILPKKHYENIFSEKLINELHAWIENHPHVILSTNAKDSFFVKINGTIVKEHNHILQISVRELHNDMIFKGYFFGARTVDEKLFIGDTSLRKYTPKIIKPMSNRDKITRG